MRLSLKHQNVVRKSVYHFQVSPCKFSMALPHQLAGIEMNFQGHVQYDRSTCRQQSGSTVFHLKGNHPTRRDTLDCYMEKKNNFKIVLTYQSGGPYLSESGIILINTEISTLKWDASIASQWTYVGRKLLSEVWKMETRVMQGQSIWWRCFCFPDGLTMLTPSSDNNEKPKYCLANALDSEQKQVESGKESPLGSRQRPQEVFPMFMAFSLRLSFSWVTRSLIKTHSVPRMKKSGSTGRPQLHKVRKNPGRRDAETQNLKSYVYILPESLANFWTVHM